MLRTPSATRGMVVAPHHLAAQAVDPSSRRGFPFCIDARMSHGGGKADLARTWPERRFLAKRRRDLTPGFLRCTRF